MLRAILVCDDIWHPAEVIERGLKCMDTEDIEFDVIRTAKDILTPAMLREYDVLIVAKGNAINAANSAPWFEDGVTECGPEEIRDYVREGGALLALHAGLCLGRGAAEAYNDVVGSYFLGHPPRCMTHVHVTKEHPIAKGVRDFSQRDEHYQLAVTAQDADIFMVTTSETGGTFPSGYTRAYGKGRVAALTPGHTLSVWQDPNFQLLLKNAVRWCARRED